MEKYLFRWRPWTKNCFYVSHSICFPQKLGSEFLYLGYKSGNQGPEWPALAMQLLDDGVDHQVQISVPCCCPSLPALVRLPRVGQGSSQSISDCRRCMHHATGFASGVTVQLMKLASTSGIWESLRPGVSKEMCRKNKSHLTCGYRAIFSHPNSLLVPFNLR